METKQILFVVQNEASYPIVSPQKVTSQGSSSKETEAKPSGQNPAKSGKQNSILKQLERRVFMLEERIQKLNFSDEKQEKKMRKMRRKAKQIEKKYQCKEEGCGRVYGSETSLKGHIRIKHEGKNECYI